MRVIFKWHDRMTIAGNYIAIALLFIIAVSLCYEVGSRYLFNAPTIWASSLGAYLFCAAIFLAAPDLTRRNAHVVINVLGDALPPIIRAPYLAAVWLLSGSICLFAAWFCGIETVALFAGGIETILEWPVPKWIVSMFVPYGYANTALYLFRNIGAPPANHGPEAVA